MQDHTPTALFTYRTDDIDAQFKKPKVETLREVYDGWVMGGPRQGFVMVDRGGYWQCGYVVRKGGFAEVTERSLRPSGSPSPVPLAYAARASI